ncbi:STAS domain-containing protein [Maridesulfovibrio sp.]|uniref:STAS domain-containing protein n=1 Tax=Maridesulfovibrio sp. TaxID=2795000 RepID=UPI0029CA67D9|nr:STAS domain-containing protein [Maridesulfovibrio sp.]
MFDFIEEERDECVLLYPKGHFNHSTVPLIRDRLYEHCNEYGCRIVMCMKDVDLIDSAGLGVMVHAHKFCDKYGGMIVYSDFNDMIIKNMTMLTMDRYLNFSPTVDSALERFDW